MIAQTSIETIQELLDKLRSILLIAEIPEEQLHIRNGKHRTNALSRAFNWLHDFSISPELKEFKSVRALLPEKTWNHYILFEISDLREQILLRRASQKLAARWRRKRPAMFNSDIKRKKNHGSA